MSLPSASLNLSSTNSCTAIKYKSQPQILTTDKSNRSQTPKLQETSKDSTFIASQQQQKPQIQENKTIAEIPDQKFKKSSLSNQVTQTPNKFIKKTDRNWQDFCGGI